MTTKIIKTKPQLDILLSRQPVNLFLAGQGSGKSFCAGLVSANYICHFPLMRGIICANTYGQFTRSTMFRIREVWKSCFGWVAWSDRTKKGSGPANTASTPMAASPPTSCIRCPVTQGRRAPAHGKPMAGGGDNSQVRLIVAQVYTFFYGAPPLW